jgi:hypothetical protein
MVLRTLERREFLARATAVAVATATAALGCARQESRVPSSTSSAPATAARPTSLDTAVRSALLAMARRVFPHDELPDELYAVVVDALAGAAAQPPVAAMLLGGLRDLDAAAGGSWLTAPVDKQTALLGKIEATPFFQTVRGTAVFTFYNQPKVWDAFGYEGDAWSKGGYLARGLNDIDWLPEPRASGVTAQPSDRK